MVRLQRFKENNVARTLTTYNYDLMKGKVTHISVKGGGNDPADIFYKVSLTMMGEEIPLFSGIGGASNTNIHKLGMDLSNVSSGLRLRLQTRIGMSVETVVFYE